MQRVGHTAVSASGGLARVVFVSPDKPKSFYRIIDRHLRFVADLNGASYVVAPVQPGKQSFYAVTADGDPVSMVAAEVAANRTYFVHVGTQYLTTAIRRDSVGWFSREHWLSNLTRLRTIDAAGAREDARWSRDVYASAVANLERSRREQPASLRQMSELRTSDGE